MECEKCGFNFEEKELELSHNIPKYMEGTDKEGRHWLCNKCHQEYESEIMKVCWMNYVKTLPEEQKKSFRSIAQMVSKYYFKNKRGNNGANNI